MADGVAGINVEKDSVNELTTVGKHPPTTDQS